MTRKLMLLFLMLAATLGVLRDSALAADQGRNKSPAGFAKVAQGDSATNRTLININNLAMWIYGNGQSATYPVGNAPGLYFPRGTNPTVATIYQDGFVWGGRVNDGGVQNIRVGGQTFYIGTVAGAILSPGVAEDPNDERNVQRVWRVRRDFATANLRQDAAEFFLITAAQVTDAQIEQLRNLYRVDWLEWPAYKGAPFYDADGDGVYTPGFKADGTPKLAPPPDSTFNPAIHADEPGYADGDQVVWLVVNDLDGSATQNMYGSDPIGLEMQLTLWAYRRTDALGNIVFKQFRVIYKGTATTPPNATLQDFYFCQFSDPDLGNSGDDYVGCDTTLSLGYVYNSLASDGTYAQVGLPPPAAGYDFFAGPIVPDPNSVAVFGLKERPGFRNLPMSTFSFFASGQVDQDPPSGTYTGTTQWYNLLRGFRPLPEFPPDPWVESGNITKFRVSGDPVNSSGPLDANAGDRRMLLATGPFTMAVGDTQETVIASISAQGSDRLSSISVLKFYDRFAQEAFDNLFELPKPPAAPKVVASEYDGQILLNWATDQNALNETENVVTKGFAFEGYNVYQLPNAGASIEQGIKLGTFDVSNTIRTISQETFDPRSGLILTLPVQFGNDSGISRTFSVDHDRIRDTPLINGQVYYFGVTAYSYNPDPIAALKTLESPPSIVTVVPQSTKPGVRLSSSRGETLDVTHAGLSDGGVEAIVIDPAKTTGQEYEVSFADDTHGGYVWNLTNKTTGAVLLTNQTNQSGDDNYLIVDGLQVKVVGPPQSFKRFLTVANAAGPIDPPTSACFSFNSSGFPTPDGLPVSAANDRPFNQQSTNASRWGIHTADDGTRAGFTPFLGRVSNNGGNWARIIPYDWEIRFTANGGYAYDPFATGRVFQVPFEIWRTGIATPDDPSDDVRMVPYVLDDDGDGTFNLCATHPNAGADEHTISGGDDDPYTDWIYFATPEDATPGDAGYKAWEAAALAIPGLQDDGSFYNVLATDNTLRRIVLVNFNGGSISDPSFPANVNALLPETGTVFSIISNKVNTTADKFNFTSKAPSYSLSTAKADIAQLLNVFPNPYYGFNSYEQNQFVRFVTFNHLPEKAIVRIFNLAGVLVRTITKGIDDVNTSQFLQWNLQNENGLPVASGIYIARIECPDVGVVKDLKLAIVQEQQFLRNF